MIRILTFILSLAFATPVFAHGYGADDLIVAHPYSFPTSATAQTGIGYLTIMNNGSEPDRLIEVRSPFPRATLHETVMENNIARMIGSDGFDIPPLSTVKLEPGGKHIMFMGLNGDPFEVGEKFTVTLVVERAGEVEVEFWVEERNGSGQEIDHSHHDHSSVDPDISNDRSLIRSTLQDQIAAHLDLAAVAVIDDVAVAGWTAGQTGGRAFLRRSGDNWQVTLLSGSTLATSAGIQAGGLSPRVASSLLAQLNEAEASLAVETVEKLDHFKGTVIVQ
ncbi:copper uptake system-associated protein [Pseudaestuariivita rosea]|uniref:copper uptake system-associated protein n=1 Tax=Pseudaestuariivita rosea TaxID=2763263 RepID=UPI001ABB3368|nr:copper uptake system-associated protein [Pseudaestuariivita rosea]